MYSSTILETRLGKQNKKYRRELYLIHKEIVVCKKKKEEEEQSKIWVMFNAQSELGKFK